MLAETQLNQLKSLVGNLSHDELIWSQGFLAGVLSTKNNSLPIATPNRHQENTTSVSTKKVTILYGTETGNSKSLALKFTQKVKSAGQPC